MTDLPNGFSRANDNELVLHGVGSVFEALDIVTSRDQWAEMNAEAGTDYPYPFADVVAFPTPGDAVLKELPEEGK